MTTTMKHKKKKRSPTWVYIPLVAFAVIALLPLYYLIITAMKSYDEAALQATMFPIPSNCWKTSAMS